MLAQEGETVVTVMRMTGEERGWTLHCLELFDHPNNGITFSVSFRIFLEKKSIKLNIKLYIVFLLISAEVSCHKLYYCYQCIDVMRLKKYCTIYY